MAAVPRPRHDPLPLVVATAVFLVWMLATWLFEGRLHTLLRPEATRDRIVYAVVVNIVVGSLGGLAAFAWIAHRTHVDVRNHGFPRPLRTVIAVIAALAVAALLVGPRLPTWQPAVLVNAGAQVLVTSIAEVIVCWLVVGGAVHAFASRYRRPLHGWIAMTIVSSVAFGVYHFAHSPPFNSVATVAFLTGVGVVTSVFFAITRDLIGTVVLHNAFGVLGVMQALDRQGQLASFAHLRASLIATASIVLLIVVVADVLLRRAPHRADVPHVRVRSPRHA